MDIFVRNNSTSLKASQIKDLKQKTIGELVKRNLYRLQSIIPKKQRILNFKQGNSFMNTVCHSLMNQKLHQTVTSQTQPIQQTPKPIKRQNSIVKVMSVNRTYTIKIIQQGTKAKVSHTKSLATLKKKTQLAQSTKNIIQKARKRVNNMAICKLSYQDLFNKKVNQRVQISKQILSKLKQMNTSLGVSIVHASIAGNTRIVEAFLDSCENDFERNALAKTTDQYKRNALHYACAIGNISMIESLMSVSVDPWFTDIHGRVCLHYCSLNDQAEPVQKIFKLLKTSIKFRQPLEQSSNCRQVARLLKYPRLKKQAKIVQKFKFTDEQVPQFTTIVDFDNFKQDLTWLLQKMNYNKADQRLFRRNTIKKNSFVNSFDSSGFTPLHLAVIFNNPNVVRVLIQKKAEICIKDFHKKAPWEYSSSIAVHTILISKLKTAKKLPENFNQKQFKQQLSKNRDIMTMTEEELNKIRIEDNGDTVLIDAVRKFKYGDIRQLLEKKISPYVKNSFGWNAVHIAYQMKSKRTSELLILGTNKNLDQNFKTNQWIRQAWKALDDLTKEGQTVLSICILQNNPDLLKWTIKFIKDRETVPHQLGTFKVLSDFFSEKAFRNMTVFLLAVKLHRLQELKILVNNGIDWTQKNEQDQNALHLASASGNKQMVQYLIWLDADFNRLREQKDLRGRKPKDLDIQHKLKNSFQHIWDWAANNNTQKLQNLSTNSFSVNQQTSLRKDTPLHIAVVKQNISAVIELLKAGADPIVKNQAGISPLDLARRCKQPFQKQLLKLFHGESLEVTNVRAPLAKSLYQKVRAKSIQEYQSLPQFSNPRAKAVVLQESYQYWWKLHQILISKNLVLNDFFSMQDSDKDGVLSFVEFQGMLLCIGMEVTTDQAQSLAMLLDGDITYSSIMNCMFEAVWHKRNSKRVKLY